MIINYHNINSICASASALNCIGRFAPVYWFFPTPN